MNKITKILLPLILFNMSISAQSNIENLLYNQTTELNHQFDTLDSLKVFLEQIVTLINSEKLKNPNDDEKITNLFSSTASITNSIDSIMIEIDELNKKINSTKQRLYNFYSTKIDSINNEGKENKSNNIERIKYIEKRLLVSPVINILSFSPENVFEIKPTNDTLKQRIYYEYLDEAHKEVKNKIAEIENLKMEIENIIVLKEETREFLEDIDFDDNYAVYSNPADAKNNSDELFSGSEARLGDNSPQLNTLKSQTKTFSDLLYQFGLSNYYDIETYLDSRETSSGKNLKDFTELIKNVQDQLNDYKIIIRNKLEATKIK